MIDDVIARLKTNASSLKLVEGAAKFAALKSNPPVSKQPAAWVFPVSDAPGANALAVGVRQRVVERIGVALALGDVGDRRGEAAAKSIETLRDEVRDAIVGWQPSAAFDQFTYARGALVDFRNGVVWFEMEFETAILIGTG